MRYWLLVAILCLLGLPAKATEADLWWQCVANASSGGAVSQLASWCPASTQYPVPVSATLNGFAPSGNYSAPLSVSSSSSNVALPSGSPTTIVVYNVGSAIAYTKLGTSNAVTATTSDDAIQPGSAQAFTVGSNTYLAAITASSTTTLNISGGSGLPTGWGGGSSSGGGTVAQGNAGSNAQAWWAQIGDTTHGPAAVKAASTAAVATDPSLVVQFSPNTPSLPLPTGAATSANQTTQITAEQAIQTSAATIATNTAAPVPSQSSTVPIGGVSLCDGANGATNPCTTAATVKAASTAAAATDKSVVVQINPAQPNLTTPLNVALAANQSINLAQINATSTASLMVAASTAPVTATNPALTVDLRPDSPGIVALGPAAVSGAVPFVLSSQYPVNAVTTTPQPVTATATGTTAATVATIPAVASKTAFICGFTITADATALAVGTAVVSGTISGSLSYLQGISAVTSGAGNLTQAFNPCIPASAANTAIVVTSAAAGTGGNTIVNAQGYYL